MVLKCPKCKSANITQYMGSQFGKYQCKACSYIGSFILDEDIVKVSPKKKNKKTSWYPKNNKMWKTITKKTNKKFIFVYYGLALIFVSIGLFTGDASWYVMAMFFLILASMRKYILMKRLKEWKKSFYTVHSFFILIGVM